MTPLTPEQREYKQATLNQLITNLPQLESELNQAEEPAEVHRLSSQLEDVQNHLELLQQELAQDVALQPVADELYRQAATALVKEKFYMARRYIAKLEAIEPFYPELDRLKRDANQERASRRTRSISQSEVLPSARPLLPAKTFQTALASGSESAAPALPVSSSYPAIREDLPEKRGIAQFFQWHIILSCLVLMLILCVMAGVGGVSLLEWFIEGL